MTPEQTKNNATMTPFRLALATLALCWFPYVGAVAVLRRVASGWPHPFGWIASDFVAVVITIVALLLVQRRTSKSWASAFQDLGMGRVRLRDVLAGVLTAVPALIGLAIAFAVTEGDRSFHRHFVTTVIRIILAQALLEEMLFRGFLFKRLARQLTYRRAASLAAVAFGLCHFANLMLHGVSAASMVETSIQVVMTIILAFAPTYLVWRSGGILWGACVWHLLIDVSILFPKLTPDPQSAIPVLVGTLLTVPCGWLVTRWLYATQAHETAPK